MEYNKPIGKITKISFEEWLSNIMLVHPAPTILMIAIGEDGKFSLLGASSNVEAMNLVLEQKAQRNPLVG